MPNTRPAPFCACAALVLLVVHAHQSPPTIHAHTCTAGRAVAESARGSGDVFALPLALLDPLLSLSQGSHKGPEGPRESGVFAFCPSVRRHECREQPLRQQQAPRRALSRAIPVVNAQRSGSTHAQSEAPARPADISPCSLEGLVSRAFVIAGGKAPVQIVTESERTCSAEPIKRACWVLQRRQQGRWHAQAKTRKKCKKKTK